MTSESILITSAPSATAADAQPTFAVRTYAMVSDYWALTKPEVNFLIAMATFTGFYLGHATEPQGFPFWLQQGHGGSGRNCRSNGKRLNLKDPSSSQTGELSTMAKNWTAAELRSAR